MSDRFPPCEVFGLPELEHRVQFALVFLLDGDFSPQLVDAVEEGIELIEVFLRDRVELVVVARAHPTVSPRNASPVVLTRSTTASTRYCSKSMPPSSLIMVLR